MGDFQSILNSTFLENTIQNYLVCLVILVAGLVFRGWLSNSIISLFTQSFRNWDYKLTREEYRSIFKKRLNFFLFVIIIYLAFHNLSYPESLNLRPVEEFGLKRIIMRAYQVLMAVAITRLVIGMVKVFTEMMKRRASVTASKQDDQLIPFISEIVRIIIVIIATLIVLSSVFKLNVASLVAGLGIGGLAIALAAKESLENLFGSFTIFFDKPFVVGDMVKVGGAEGVVEKVGFRSTRIRTLEKSYLTIPNRDMINAQLDNMSLRTFRRVRFSVGLTYGTKSETIKSVVDQIKKYLESHENTNQDSQVRFMDFGSSSLDIMVLYYIDTMDWDKYLEIKEEINYKVMEIVEKSESDFAFPTQTIHLQKENG